jgi:hypothetical protein
LLSGSQEVPGSGATRPVPNSSGGQLGERPRPHLLRGYLRLEAENKRVHPD